MNHTARRPQPPISIKLVIIGDGGVGKSSITTALLRREFVEDWDPTIEDSYSTNLCIEGQDYNVEIVDTAGQEEYRGLWGEQTVRDGDGFILTYAIDSKSSFELLPMFLHTIRKVKSEHEEPTEEPTPANTPFPFIVLGNKCDLPPSTRVVSAQEGLLYTRSLGGLFNECSAKLRVNIDSSFSSIVLATARSKAAHEAWLRKRGGGDEGFNGNVEILRKEREGRGRRGGKVESGEGGWDKEGDDEGFNKKRNESRRSYGGCCSVSCIIS